MTSLFDVLGIFFGGIAFAILFAALLNKEKKEEKPGSEVPTCCNSTSCEGDCGGPYPLLFRKWELGKPYIFDPHSGEKRYIGASDELYVDDSGVTWRLI